MLQAIDLSKRYEDGVLALDALNLNVAPGEIYCLLGANGAGKTTTLRAVSGTVRRSGRIELGGKPLRGGPEAVGGGGKVRRKGGDPAERTRDGLRRGVPELQVFHQPLAERRHGETPAGREGTLAAW